MVKTAPNLKEPEEKLRWIFQTFDKGCVDSFNKIMSSFCSDGGGKIDDDEVYGVVITLFKMLDRELNDDDLDDIVDDILEKVDENGDGEISEWEFIHHATKCSFLADLIENHTGGKS